MKSIERKIIRVMWLVSTTTACSSSSKDRVDTVARDTADSEFGTQCPPASGWPLGTNVLRGYIDVDVHDLVFSEAFDTSSWLYSSDYYGASESWDFYSISTEDVKTTSRVFADVQCTAEGYFYTTLSAGVDLTPRIISAPLSFLAEGTLDPPILIFPADPYVGATWNISSVRTFTSETGYVWTDLYEDQREIVAQETLNVELDRVATELTAWRVETAHGQTLWYADYYGLIKADDRIVTGSWYEPPDTERER